VFLSCGPKAGKTVGPATVLTCLVTWNEASLPRVLTGTINDPVNSVFGEESDFSQCRGKFIDKDLSEIGWEGAVTPGRAAYGSASILLSKL
jgi:hypothetical protein